MGVTDTVGTYDTKMSEAFAGMIAEGQPSRDISSRKVETAEVAFGLAVGLGAADESCKLSGAGFEGITVADKSREADKYAVGEVAGLMREGTIWVTASTNVAPSDPVTFTAATGVIGAGLATAIDGAKFETTASAGDLVKVYLG